MNKNPRSINTPEMTVAASNYEDILNLLHCDPQDELFAGNELYFPAGLALHSISLRENQQNNHLLDEVNAREMYRKLLRAA